MSECQVSMVTGRVLVFLTVTARVMGLDEVWRIAIFRLETISYLSKAALLPEPVDLVEFSFVAKLM